VLQLKRESIPQAVNTLGDRSWLLLSSDQVREFAEVSPCPGSSDLVPFLVRGVAHGGVQTYTIIRHDPSTRWLVVSHATYNGENFLFSWGLRRVLPLPVIVFLAEPPAEVLPTAELGGDWLFYGRRLTRVGAHTCAAQQGDEDGH
jgi:hypothetical protein